MERRPPGVWARVEELLRGWLVPRLVPTIRFSRCSELGDLSIEVDFVWSEFLQQFSCDKGQKPVRADELFQVVPLVLAVNHLAILLSGVFVLHGRILDVGCFAA